MFACTRILYSLSNDGMAHKLFGKLNKRGVPMNALYVTLAFALLSLLTSFIAESTLFVVLLSVSGIGGTITWLIIALSQYRFRKQYLKDGGKLEDLKYRVRLFPFIPILCISICILLFASTAIDPTQRVSLFLGFGFIGLCYLYYYLRYTRKKKVIQS